MVTRTVIHVTSPEAAALAATATEEESSPSSSFAAEAENSTAVDKQTTTLLTKNDSVNKNGGGKKRALPPKDNIISGKEVKKRQRADRFVMDLGDVPPQPPIPKSEGRIKEGASKYAGVSFHKSSNKWLARIRIDGEQHQIGLYDNEDEAAIDYARAVFKYQGQEALDTARERKQSALAIDLSDVPIQPPIPKKEGRQKEGASKYTGVSFSKTINKWTATIMIEGKNRRIGDYMNEEEAAIDYARAAFKYKVQDPDKKRKQKKSAPSIDLSDVPPQLPIPKSKRYIKEGTSKYIGVYNIKRNKWHAQVRIDGKQQHIGYYENEEQAAADYARAVFKFKGQEALDKAREQASSAPSIDLSDVPPQSPIPKSEGCLKEGSSKYAGVSFHKPRNKWLARIRIDGEQQYIGYYENEEEAAIDHARAVFKYQGEEALAKLREQKSSGSEPAINIDLSDVPPQQPVPKIKGRIKEGASKYVGIYFNKGRNKWHAQIMIEGKTRHIGLYVNEEEAAADYARAVFKYQGQEALAKLRAQNLSGSGPAIDLSDVQPQQPIPKSEGRIKEGSSKYAGVSFRKTNKKWEATIGIDGKSRHIGYYEKEEEAAIDYARAVFKYKGQEALDKAKERRSLSNFRVHQPPQCPKHLLL